MKNYSEQIKFAVINDPSGFTAATANTVLDGDTDVKIQDSKIIDTSGNETGAFSGLSAGDVVYVSGWDYTENNGVFTVVSVSDDDTELKLDYPLLNEPAPDSPGVTLYDTPETMTVSGVETDTCVITGVSNVEIPDVYDANLFKVTADDTVSHFAGLTGTDNVAVIWADLSLG